MGDLDLILGRLARVYRTGRPVALLFDYDGTLAPIRPTPAEATLAPSVRRALGRLAARLNVSVGVLSGRGMVELRKMAGLEGVYYAATGGLEMDLLGRRLTPPGIEAARAPLDQLAARLTDVAARHHGAWVEQKPFGVTLHYRAVPLKFAGSVRLEAIGAMAPWCGQVRVEDETLGLQVVPEVGWDKGTAVHQILADLPGDVFPIYAGDAAGDVPAFAAVETAGGLSIGVGPNVRATGARVPGSGVVGSLAILLANILHDSRRMLASGAA